MIFSDTEDLMKRIIAGAVVFLLLLTIGTGAEARRKKGVLRVPGGTNIEGVGLVIDASYDPRLDGLVPGYKMLSVAIINQSFNIISLDPENDVWQVKLAGESKAHNAIYNLRSDDPKQWQALPEKLRDLLAYPLMIPIGGRDVIDLFLPERLDLERFVEVDIAIKSLGGKLEVVVRD